MKGEQSRLPGVNGKGKKPEAREVREVASKWLSGQSTGQLVLLLSEIADVLHGREVMVRFVVEPRGVGRSPKGGA